MKFIFHHCFCFNLLTGLNTSGHVDLSSFFRISLKIEKEIYAFSLLLVPVIFLFGIFLDGYCHAQNNRVLCILGHFYDLGMNSFASMKKIKGEMERKIIILRKSSRPFTWLLFRLPQTTGGCVIECHFFAFDDFRCDFHSAVL